MGDLSVVRALESLAARDSLGSDRGHGRAYRDTRLRASTGQIGLARLNEGTELVRIGQPMLPEFAAWRYGRMFTRRYWRANALGFQGTAIGLLQLGAQLSPWHGSGFAMAGVYSAVFGWHAFELARAHRRKRAPTIGIRDGDGVLRRLSVADAGSAVLTDRDDGRWKLLLHYRESQPAGAILRAVGKQSRFTMSPLPLEIGGESARRALATMLPVLNVGGASSKTVASVVSAVSERRSLKDAFLVPEDREGRSYMKLPRLALAALPAGYRLGLEMTLHEQDERRALEGELRELEARWREADEIAAIADGMLLPDSIEQELRDRRERVGQRSETSSDGEA